MCVCVRLRARACVCLYKHLVSVGVLTMLEEGIDPLEMGWQEFVSGPIYLLGTKFRSFGGAASAVNYLAQMCC